MKIIILAGGFGTRLSEYTNSIPKPMIKIANLPIIVHILNHYVKYGFNDFIVAAGYKNHIFQKFFKIGKNTKKPVSYKIKNKTCKIQIINTGLKTMTGGRLKRLKNYLPNDESFMFTYGDGVSNINLKKLLNFHKRKNKLITITAVRPPARFGEIILKKERVVSFKEKPQVTNGWINGGFFVAKKKFLDFISGDNETLERKPLEKMCKKNQLVAFKHHGFWKCMDVRRDIDELQKIYKKNKFR